MSRPAKRSVRTLYLDVAGKPKKYFLKQAGIQPLQVGLKALFRFQALHPETVRELLLIKLFRHHGIPVPAPVAWGTFTVLGWPIRGFLLVEEVRGREFVEVYREASLRIRRRLMRVHGELMGELHQKGIESKVHSRDLICISQDYTNFQKCLVVIDRERGATESGSISFKHRGKRLAEIWIKGAFMNGPGERSELLAFLSGYCAGSRMLWQSKEVREYLVDLVFDHAADILARDDRFAGLRPYFKEKYSISPK